MCLVKWPRADFCFIFIFSSESLYLVTGEFNSFTFITMTDAFGPIVLYFLLITLSLCFFCALFLHFSGLSYIFTNKIRM